MAEDDTLIGKMKKFLRTSESHRSAACHLIVINADPHQHEFPKVPLETVQ